MSPQDALRRLQRLAQAGNPHARLALASLVAQNTPPPRAAADTIVGRSFDQEILERSGDDLEMADAVAREADQFGADDLDRKAALRAARLGAATAAAPIVSTAPITSLNGTLGGQQIVKTGVSAGGIVPRGDAVQVANWQGLDTENRAVTVTFGPVVASGQNIAADFGLRPIGIVQWNSRGMALNAEVDIRSGCEFTIGANAVMLQVALDGGGSGVADGLQAQMTLAGSLSFDPLGRDTKITRTAYFDPLSGIGSHFVDVPPFAESCELWRNNESTVAVDLFAIDSNGERRYQFSLAAGSVMFDPMPLSGDIVQIEVVKTAGADSLAALIFNLGL